MKRNLNQKQYELSNGEREALWHNIRRQTHGPASSPEFSRQAFRPALAVTAVCATLTLVVAWHLGSRQIGQDPYNAPYQVNDKEIVVTRAEKGDSRAMERAQPVMKSSTVRSAAGPAELSAEEQLPGVAEARSMAAPAAKPAGTVLTGHVLDRSSQEPLAYANVTIRGTTFAATTDSLGFFRFENLPPQKDVQLVVKMLSYAPVEMALATPVRGEFKQDFELEPVVVATLQAFDVEGAEYMVEVKSGVTEHTVGKETFEKYAIDSVEDALSKQAGVTLRAGQLFVRGGRAGETSMPLNSVPLGARNVPPQAVPAPGSITGGTTPPNGEAVELMYFDGAGVNPFVATEPSPPKTTAILSLSFVSPNCSTR